MNCVLGRKQQETHERFWHVLRNIDQHVTRQEMDLAVEQAVDRVRGFTRGRRAGYCWSAGKDSLALGYVCEKAGVRTCAMGMTDLEYPRFLNWVTDHMPADLEVFNTRQDLPWLIKHPEMLFPRNSEIASRWFSGVQHRAQRQFAKKRKLDVLLLGRRRADGNQCGNDEGWYRDRDGFIRFSPLHDWTHEHVLAFLAYYHGLDDLPPTYHWPRGFRVGTGAWPARQWCTDEAHGWSEVWAIDPDIVRSVAPHFPGARVFMEVGGLT